MFSGRSAQPGGNAAQDQLQAKIDALTEDLLVEKAVYDSLRGTAGQRDLLVKMQESRENITKINGELKRLRAQRPSRPSLSSNPSAMSPAGLSSRPWASSTDLPARKRTNLDAGLPERMGGKSQRTTPSHTPPSRILHDFDQDSSIIDLTGDDEDLRRTFDLMKREEDRMRQNKLRADQDAAFARRMQEGGFSSSPTSHPGGGSSQPSSSSQPSRNAFDRILPRPTRPSSQSQPTARTETSPAIPHRAHAAGPSGPRPAAQPSRPPQMPGTYHSYDSDDSDSSLELIGVRSLSDFRPSLPGPSVPSRPTLPGLPSLPPGHVYPGMGYAPGVPAVELARQASMARQANFAPNGFAPASSYGMHPYNTGAWGHDRPGQLVNGYYDTSMPNNSLRDTINRTNSYNWNDLTDENGDPLNAHLRSYIDDYVHDPRKTQQEIQELLANIRPDMEIQEEERGETPDALKYPLYVHQQLALDWMTKMEEGTNKGGVLADDMGLGKTISTLSLMVTRKAADSVKTNLIIGPVALIRQWEMEIKKKLKIDHRLSVFLLHGKKATYADLKKFDVKSKFFRIILDEAQCIKNKDTKGAQAAAQLRATYRWCLTGTPMMNGVYELYPLIRFLRIKPYHDQKRFNTAFGSLSAKKATNNQRTSAMTQLQILLKAIMLRRMKTSEINGKPIITLPEKIEHTEHVVFSDDEARFYKDLEGNAQVKFSKYLRAGTVGKNYSNILVLLLRLRQACCHPHLNLDFDIASNNEISEEEMVALAKSLEPSVVARLREVEAFECPICYEPVSDPTLVIPCGHDTCSECFANLTSQAEQNNLQNGQEGSNAKCPQCRGVLNPQKTITYTTFQKVHMPEKLLANGGEGGYLEGGFKATEANDDGSDESDDSESEAESTDDDDDDANSDGDLRDFIVPDEDDEDYKEGAGSAVKRRKSKKSKGKRKSKGKKKVKEVLPHELKTLRKDASKNKEARSRYMRYLKKNWEDSAKVTKTTEILAKIQETGEKTIVFSQWTSLLDLVEIPLKHELGIRYCRYDGGMSRDQRDKSVTDFVDNLQTKVMLVSLRAGNAGLNLTVASHIVILDPFWNPYIEMQAVDRAHRIGQQRNVHIHRILIEGTVEDRIVELQERKRQLINTALDEGDAKNLSRLSMQELSHLFGVQ
ncbi:P-loop containing nucleoside triphosphate hydrolase protein [Thozetella sp. PMI_491]|nr:P-loop containing nucleoside triphosphate hydrolase protein [Thozetella sp. PMI_491]